MRQVHILFSLPQRFNLSNDLLSLLSFFSALITHNTQQYGVISTPDRICATTDYQWVSSLRLNPLPNLGSPFCLIFQLPCALITNPSLLHHHALCLFILPLPPPSSVRASRLLPVSASLPITLILDLAGPSYRPRWQAVPVARAAWKLIICHPFEQIFSK